MADTKKMLNFKMGLDSALANVAKVPGTFYATTDKPALYLDIDADTRIRVGGGVVSLADSDALASLQPWHEGELYYLKKEDVLVLYNGSSFDLINESLVNQLSELNTKLTNTQADLATTTGNLGTLTSTVGTIASKDTNGDGTADIVTVGQWIAHLEGRTTASEGKIVTAESAISTLQDEVAAIKGTGTDSIGSLKEMIEALQLSDRTQTSNITTLQTNVATNTGDITNLKSDVATAQQDIIKAQNQADKGVADAAKAQSKADTNAEEISTLKTTVNGHTVSIGAINDSILALDERIDSNDTDIDNLQKADEALEEAYKAADKAIEDAYKDADGKLQTSINNVSANLTTESQERVAADNQIRTDFAAADTQVRQAFAAADTKIRQDFEAADSALETAYKAADSALDGKITSTNTNLADEIKNRQKAVADLSKSLTDTAAEIREEFADADEKINKTLTSHGTAIENLQKAVGEDGLGSRVTTLETNYNTLSATVGEHTTAINTLNNTTIPGINKEIKNIKDSMATDTELSEVKTELEGKIATAQGAAEKAQGDVNALKQTVTALSADVETNYAKKSEVEAEADARAKADAALAKRIKVFEDGGAKDVAALATRVETNKTNIATNTSNISKNAGNISTNSANISTNTTNIATNTADIAAMKKDATITTFKGIEDKIKTSIAESDAMVYKGTFGTGGKVTTLPTDALQGHTYKVVSAIDDFVDGVDLKVGDLLIASKDNPSSNADWDYVPSGGQDHNNLTIWNNGTSITLKDDENTVKGSVAITSGNTSIEVTGDDNGIAISMVWGTF